MRSSSHLHTLHTYLLLHTSYLTFYILHDTAIILTPRYYATLRGDKVHWLPFSDIIMGHHDIGHWLRAGVMVQLMFSCSMHLCISSCIVSIIVEDVESQLRCIEGCCGKFGGGPCNIFP